MAHELPQRPAAKRSKSANAVSILPELNQPHNRMTKVSEGVPAMTSGRSPLVEAGEAKLDW